jgi:hypothetical protein
MGATRSRARPQQRGSPQHVPNNLDATQRGTGCGGGGAAAADGGRTTDNVAPRNPSPTTPARRGAGQGAATVAVGKEKGKNQHFFNQWKKWLIYRKSRKLGAAGALSRYSTKSMYLELAQPYFLSNLRWSC